MRDVRKTIDKDGIDHMILTPLSLFPSLSYILFGYHLVRSTEERSCMSVPTKTHS